MSDPRPSVGVEGEWKAAGQTGALRRDDGCLQPGWGHHGDSDSLRL